MAIFIISTILLMGFVSFFLTYLLIKFTVRKNILVLPNARSLHDLPTPRIGGLAIVISWYIGITVLYKAGIIEKHLFYALLCGILIAIVSLMDDLREISPVIRLIIHLAASIMAFWFLDGLRPLVLPDIKLNYDYFTYPISILGMVWFINLFNFMDGVDGFASVEAIFISCVLFVISWNLINILLIVTVAGFLCYNWPKAKIFMGDIGSTQLGFILVVLGIYYHNSFEFSILNWIMLTSPFWFDATLTLFRRWRNGEKISVAHCKHAYQRLVQAGFSHERVNFFLILINLFIVILIIFYRGFRFLQIPVFVFSMVFFYMIVRNIDRKVPFSKDNE